MYIFFDIVIPLLRILTEMKDQYTRICIKKKKERKIKQKK